MNSTTTICSYRVSWETSDAWNSCLAFQCMIDTNISDAAIPCGSVQKISRKQSSWRVSALDNGKGGIGVGPVRLPPLNHRSSFFTMRYLTRGELHSYVSSAAKLLEWARNLQAIYCCLNGYVNLKTMCAIGGCWKGYSSASMWDSAMGVVSSRDTLLKQLQAETRWCNHCPDQSLETEWACGLHEVVLWLCHPHTIKSSSKIFQGSLEFGDPPRFDSGCLNTPQITSGSFRQCKFSLLKDHKWVVWTNCKIVCSPIPAWLEPWLAATVLFHKKKKKLTSVELLRFVLIFRHIKRRGNPEISTDLGHVHPSIEVHDKILSILSIATGLRGYFYM